MRRAHRTLGLLLSIFLALHLGNHLAGLAGQAVHGVVQEALRTLYRHPWVEPVLLLLVAGQAVLGLALVARRRRWTLQSVSGCYLALFLLIHVGAVLSARAAGVETDLAFAAAGLHAPAPWPVLFAAYYGLAVLAAFTHLSVPLSRRSVALGRATVAAGGILAVAIVALLSGKVTPLVISPGLIAAFP